MLLVGVGMLIAWKLFSAKNAEPQTVAQTPASQRQSAEPAEAASKLAATAKTAEATPPAKSSPPIANSTIEKPAQPDATDSSPLPTAAPSAGRTRDTVALPAPMEQLVVGGSGKYLVAALPSVKQVAVVDVAAKQIAKLVPVDDTDLLLAAGETKFVVFERGQGILSRYDLKTGARELAESCEPYAAIAMGSSSEGPLFAVGANTSVINVGTLKPTVTKATAGFRDASINLLASADGKVFGASKTNTSPTGMSVFEINGESFQEAYAHVTYRSVIPSPSGEVIYSGQKRFDLKCQLLPGQQNLSPAVLLLPAATGPFYMAWLVPGHGGRGPAPTGLTIHCPNDDTPLLTVKDVVLPDFESDVRARLRSKFPLERRLFWLPIADALVTVRVGYEQLVIQRFNLKEELDNGGIDYFRVASFPPRLFQRGQKLSYAIDVLSKHGNVQYALESGPPGTTISPDGRLSWDVPADFSPHEAITLVKLTDGSGRELIHTIKLTDGQSTPIPEQRTVVERRTVRGRGGRTVTTTVTTRSAGPVAGPVTSPPKSMGANRWQWTGGSPIGVRTEKGTFGGVLLGDKLYFVKDNGSLSTEAVSLPASYLYAGVRSGGVIGVAANPTRVEVLDHHGKLLRTVSLENVAPTGLALHPTKPISYVGLDRSIPPMRGAFVVVDEKAAKVTTGDEDLGQDVIVDPSGRFLVSTYVHRVHVGDQIVVTQSSGRGSSRFRGRAPGRAVPPPQVGVVHRFAHVALMVVYDLDSPLQPEFHSFNPLPSPPGPMRVSYDGRRLTTHPPGGRLAKVSACNPLDFKAASIDYEYGAAGGAGLNGSDVAFHPTLPLGAIVAAPTAALFDPDTGKPISTKGMLDLPELANLSVRRALFSSDGKQLVILASDNKGENTLLRASLPLTSDQQTALRKRAASPLKSLKSTTTPLAELTAWRGGLSKPVTSAQIAADYSDSVVIVRTENSTGTGFFVGTSGLVLTCAHCVSPMDAVKVIYHPQGNSDEKNTTEATIVYRDRKTDLALLKINVKKPLHPVVLADPIDVKSGEDVTIIANPGLGTEVLDNTVTTGIISNIKRMIAGNPYIQSSAGVNPGSSGGPMFDRSGHVIGVVVLKAGIEGVGFAVPPMSIARFLLKATRHDTKQGLLERTWVDAEMKHEIPGGLMRIEKDLVTLRDKQSGQSKTRPLSDFSPGDQQLLALLATDD
ncbi:MAG TPA: trypsin-like peptidase domain-containing protein [Planctomycetaceae bacterium]|jgi:S1-C subfamily serine protease|nr:trypsin-like peptidase domain-containing protein [Planctomycetaceae bacterium]